MLFREGNGWLISGGKPEIGFPKLDEAIALADQSRDDALFVYAKVRKLTYQANHDEAVHGTDETERDLETWAARLERAGNPAHAFVLLMLSRARHRFVRGDRDGMLADIETALAANRKAYGETYNAKTGYYRAESVLVLAGEHERAGQLRDEWIGIVETTFGKRSIHLVPALKRVFAAEFRADQIDKASAVAQRLVEIADGETVGGTALRFDALHALGRALMAQGRYEEAAAVVDELALAADSYAGIHADLWAIFQLVYTAILGDPNEASRAAARNPDLYPASKQLAALLRPLLEGESLADAERSLASALSEPGLYDLVRIAALIQWGRVLEAQGRTSDAVTAYETAIAHPYDHPDPGQTSYLPVVSRVARERLAAAKKKLP